MKKTLSTILFIALTASIIVSSLSFVLGASELCRGADGYYGDCSYEPWRYQGSAGSNSGSNTGASAASRSFKGANAEVYQYKEIVRNNRPIIVDNSPSYPLTTGAMPYFTGGSAGYAQDYYGYSAYDYGLGYDSYGYDDYGYGSGYGYGGFGNGYSGYDSYDYGGYGGYGYGSNALDYGLAIGSQYATPEGRQWLGVASMIQQFFWL